MDFGGQTPRACSAGAAGTLCREVRGGAGRLAAKTACRKLSACAGRLPQTTRKWPPMAGGLKVRHRWLRCVRCCSAAAPAAPCSADARGGVARPDLAGARVAPWRPGRLLVVLWLHLLGVQPLGVTLGVAAARRSLALHRCALHTAAGCHTARDALPSLCGALARPAPAVAVGLMRADDRLPAVLRPRNRRRDVAVRSGRPGAPSLHRRPGARLSGGHAFNRVAPTCGFTAPQLHFLVHLAVLPGPEHPSPPFLMHNVALNAHTCHRSK